MGEEKGYLMLGDGENFCEVHDARKKEALKPGTDACLKDGKGVDIPISCHEGKNVERLCMGLVGYGGLGLESSSGIGDCRSKGGTSIYFRN